jgi:hypothetical protein
MDMKNKELNEYSRAQKIFNSISLFVKDILSILKYGQVLCLDTNFLIIESDKKPNNRCRFFQPFSKKIITETIASEVESAVSENKYKKILYFNKPTILSFEEIRSQNPCACPLYYNFVSWMYNPATFMSEDFHLNSFLKQVVINRQNLPNKEVVLGQIVDKLKKQHEVESDLLTSDDSVDEEWSLMGQSKINTSSKQRKAIRKNNKNCLNDTKTISLCMVYLLQNKKNITIYTSDSDFIHLIFNFFKSFANENAFKYVLLEKIKKDNININNTSVRSTLSLELNAKDIQTRLNGLLGDTYSDNWKHDYLIFKIKYWDQTKKKYFTFPFRFNDIVQKILINSRGNYFCPFAMSPIMGNWLGYKWYEPDPRIVSKDLSKSKVKVDIWLKYNHYGDIAVNQKEHEEYCLYPQKDKQNDYGFFSQFDSDIQN